MALAHPRTCGQWCCVRHHALSSMQRLEVYIRRGGGSCAATWVSSHHNTSTTRLQPRMERSPLYPHSRLQPHVELTRDYKETCFALGFLAPQQTTVDFFFFLAQHHLLASNTGHTGAPYRRTHAGRPPTMRTPEAAFVEGFRWTVGGGGSQKACGAEAAEDSTRGSGCSHPAALYRCFCRCSICSGTRTFLATITQLKE